MQFGNLGGFHDDTLTRLPFEPFTRDVMNADDEDFDVDIIHPEFELEDIFDELYAFPSLCVFFNLCPPPLLSTETNTNTIENQKMCFHAQ